jgi:ATP-dependent metalloprotease FtsH
VELDGFEENSGIVVICATNFVKSLDPALMRPGRLDKHVVVPIPDLKGRTEILEMYASKLVLDPAVELVTLAKRTAGMTGADLFNILNIAAVRSSAQNMTAVSARYIEEAFDRVVVGLERRNPMSELEKKMTAYHEGGHALVGLHAQGADPVHKATIMPRGSALGVTWSIPEKEKYSERLFELQAHLDVAMGGKAAEELIFGADNVSAGCTSDLQGATQLARRMVMNFGMAGESAAPLYLSVDDYAILSDEAKREIDQKTQRLLTDAYGRAAGILEAHKEELHRLADALVEYETLSAEEIDSAIKGHSEHIKQRREQQARRLAAGEPEGSEARGESGGQRRKQQGEAAVREPKKLAVR